MTTNIVEFAAGGLAAMQIAARGPGGYLAGFANLLAADVGDMSGMKKVLGSVDAASPVPDIVRVRNRGENRPNLATRLYQGDPQDFLLSHEAHDLAVENMLVKSLPYAVGNITMGIRGQALPTLQDCCVLLTREATSLDPADTGEGYDSLLICSSKYRPVPGNFAYQAVGTMSYSGSADPFTITPWGVLPEDAFGVSDGVAIEWFSDYPPTFFCFIADGVIDDIPLPVTPIDVAHTHIWDFTTGMLLTVSTVDVGADTATVSAVPASGHVLVGLVETLEL